MESEYQSCFAGDTSHTSTLTVLLVHHPLSLNLQCSPLRLHSQVCSVELRREGKGNYSGHSKILYSGVLNSLHRLVSMLRSLQENSLKAFPLTTCFALCRVPTVLQQIMPKAKAPKRGSKFSLRAKFPDDWPDQDLRSKQADGFSRNSLLHPAELITSYEQ
jgi:hypothetical protein